MTGEPAGSSERLLAPFVSDVLVATKGGLVWEPDGSRRPAGDFDRLSAAYEASLRRLGVEAIGLFSAAPRRAENAVLCEPRRARRAGSPWA